MIKQDRKTYTGELQGIPTNGIFVFGSNTQGRHGKGAALAAKNYFGAIYGQARGLQGCSYAICTKNLTKKIHPSVNSNDIKSEIFNLYNFALLNPHLDFYIAYSGLGTNLNGYSNKEIADMFSSWNHIGGIPPNFIFEKEFSKLLTYE